MWKIVKSNKKENLHDTDESIKTGVNIPEMTKKIEKLY